MIVLLLFAAIIFQSQSAILIRFADAPSLAICFWRLLMAVGLLAPWAIFRQNTLVSIRTLPRPEKLQLGLCGFLLFLHFYLFFRAVQETSIANAMILYSVAPIFTAIGAYLFFKERITPRLAAACFLGMAGIAVLFNESLSPTTVGLADGFRGGFWGDVWSVLAAACFSGYALTGKYVRRKLDNAAFATAIYLQTAVYAAIAMWLLETPFLGYSDTTWWAFLALAIIPTLGGHAIFTYCLNYLNVNFMSCAKLIEPVLAAAVAGWLFSEPFTHFAAIGFILTSASVVVLYWGTFTERALTWGRLK